MAENVESNSQRRSRRMTEASKKKHTKPAASIQCKKDFLVIFCLPSLLNILPLMCSATIHSTLFSHYFRFFFGNFPLYVWVWKETVFRFYFWQQKKLSIYHFTIQICINDGAHRGRTKIHNMFICVWNILCNQRNTNEKGQQELPKKQQPNKRWKQTFIDIWVWALSNACSNFLISFNEIQ